MLVDREALFSAHEARLFRYLCRVVGRRDEARDLTQDVFVRVSQAQAPSGTEPELRAWLFRIARNLAIDHHRKRRPEGASVEPVALTRPAAQDTATAVNQAIEALAPLDRDVFLLRELVGLSYDEIASACELSPDAVRSRLHRTRLDLRARLAAPIAARRMGVLRQHRRDE